MHQWFAERLQHCCWLAVTTLDTYMRMWQQQQAHAAGDMCTNNRHFVKGILWQVVST